MAVSDGFVYTEFGGGVADVIQDRGTIGDGLGVAPRAKAIAERVHIGVGANAGIAEKIPRATDRVAPFEYDEALVGAVHLQMTRSTNSRQPRAHDYDVHVLHSARNYPRAGALSTILGMNCINDRGAATEGRPYNESWFTPRGPLWYDLDCSELVKVAIESKRYFDMTLFHDDFACAVGEAPTFIVELLKRPPRTRQIRGSDLLDTKSNRVRGP